MEKKKEEMRASPTSSSPHINPRLTACLDVCPAFLFKCCDGMFTCGRFLINHSSQSGFMC